MLAGYSQKQILYIVCIGGLNGEEEELYRRVAAWLAFALLMLSLLGCNVSIRSAQADDSHVDEGTIDRSLNEAHVTASALISVEPSASWVPVGNETEVTVTIQNVADLFTWQIQLYFNNTSVNVTRAWIPTGSVFDGHNTFAPDPVYGQNYTALGASLIFSGSNWSFIGNGVLCKMTIVGLTQGNSTLTFNPANTFALDSSIDEIPIAGSGGLLTVVQNRHYIAVEDPMVVCGAFPQRETRKTLVFEGFTMTFNVTLANLGDSDESNVIVRACSNGTELGNRTTQLLRVGAEIALSFTWNTKGFTAGNYTVNFVTIPSDANCSVDNIALGGPIAVAMIGDLNLDGRVNMRDIGLVARRFQTSLLSPSWDCNCDVNDDGKIDMMDVGTVARHFMEH